MASRKAARLPVSDGLSLARRSSIRLGASIGSDQVVFQHGLIVRLLADFFEECQANLSIIDGHVTRPEHSAALTLAVRGAQARGQET